MTTQSPRGLIEITVHSVKSLMRALDSSLVRIFAFCVIGAAVIGIYQHVLEKATTPLDFWRLLLLGLGAITAEYLGVHKLIMSWHNARAFSMVAWSGIWCLGVSFAMYNVLSTGASFQAKRDGLQKASFTQSQNVNSSVDEARERLKSAERIKGDMAKLTLTPLPVVDGKTLNSVGSADAMVAGYKSNTSKWDETKGCVETNGKKTREFCANYAAAVAARADLNDRKNWDGKLAESMTEEKNARDALKAALATASETVTVTSDVTPFVSLVSTLTGKEPKAVAWIEPMQVSLVNMLLVSFAGLVSALAAIEGKPRRQFFNFSPLWNGVKNVAHMAYVAITGKSELDIAYDKAARGKVVEVQTHTKEVFKDEGFMAKLRASAAINAPHLVAAE